MADKRKVQLQAPLSMLSVLDSRETSSFLSPAAIERYRSASHPDVVSRQNVYPHDGPIDDMEDGGGGDDTVDLYHMVYL